MEYKVEVWFASEESARAFQDFQGQYGEDVTFVGDVEEVEAPE